MVSHSISFIYLFIEPNKQNKERKRKNIQKTSFNLCMQKEKIRQQQIMILQRRKTLLNVIAHYYHDDDHQ